MAEAAFRVDEWSSVIVRPLEGLGGFPFESVVLHAGDAFSETTFNEGISCS